MLINLDDHEKIRTHIKTFFRIKNKIGEKEMNNFERLERIKSKVFKGIEEEEWMNSYLNYLEDSCHYQDYLEFSITNKKLEEVK